MMSYLVPSSLSTTSHDETDSWQWRPHHRIVESVAAQGFKMRYPLTDFQFGSQSAFRVWNRHRISRSIRGSTVQALTRMCLISYYSNLEIDMALRNIIDHFLSGSDVRKWDESRMASATCGRVWSPGMVRNQESCIRFLRSGIRPVRSESR